MAVQIILTNEQARWLSKHIDSMQEDWHWNPRNRPSTDDMEHAATIKRKVDADLSHGGWDGPGSR